MRGLGSTRKDDLYHDDLVYWKELIFFGSNRLFLWALHFGDRLICVWMGSCEGRVGLVVFWEGRRGRCMGE